ncbi:hypothetical protein [Rhizobium leguminosarum]|uniref:Uncharacterized protein n=1 Tax=Rhizobium leguminosarum TaxID=384 RepID=A0A7M3DQG4_RHILE|nr:hypothetical protein [Rhizobium leguminosarum]TAY50925.1 hypothetical protein ELH90_03980 [Rhizobium leguminosarum]
MPKFLQPYILWMKVGFAVAIVSGLLAFYWHYQSLAEDAKQGRSVKIAVEATNEVIKDAEVQQVKSSTLQTTIAKARVVDDVELPRPLADAFLQRFGGEQ